MPLLAIAMLVQSLSTGGGRCESILRASATGAGSAGTAAADSVSRLVDRYVWRIVVEGHALADTWSVPNDTSLESGISALRGDSLAAGRLASALAWVIAAQDGYLAVGAGQVSADLYVDWRLPPGPARSILLDRRLMPSSRLNALRALRNYAGAHWLIGDITVILCEMASTAAMRTPFRLEAVDDPYDALQSVLTYPEEWLASLAKNLLPDADATRQVAELIIRSYGSSNAIARYLTAGI